MPENVGFRFFEGLLGSHYDRGFVALHHVGAAAEADFAGLFWGMRPVDDRRGAERAERLHVVLEEAVRPADDELGLLGFFLRRDLNSRRSAFVYLHGKEPPV